MRKTDKRYQKMVMKTPSKMGIFILWHRFDTGNHYFDNFTHKKGFKPKLETL